MKRSVASIFALILFAGVVVQAGGMKLRVMKSSSISVGIDSEGGFIRKIVNLAASENYAVKDNSCVISADIGNVNIYTAPKTAGPVTNRDGSISYTAAFGALSITWKYELPKGAAYVNRYLSVKNNSADQSIVIKSVTDCSMSFEQPFLSTHFHDDAMDKMDAGTEALYQMSSPAVYQNSLNVFMRNTAGGVFAGLKYPYWKSDLANDNMSLKYEVNYRIKPAETLELPTMFAGVYKNTGYTCRKQLHWTPRILNTEQEEMDWGEVRAMQKLMRDYIPEEKLPGGGYYLWLNSWWANSNLHHRVGDTEAQQFCELFLSAKDSGSVDTVLIAPVWMGWTGFIEPSPEIAGIGDDAKFPMNPQIQKMLDYAKSIDMPLFGFCEPGALERKYREDRPDWKVQESAASDKTLVFNCFANPEYMDWWFRITCDVIDRCGINGWAWDHYWVRRPFTCYGKNHGHEPGNNEFAQYKYITDYIRKLRKRYPSHLLEIYWGLKEAGTWSHKGLNTLENIYENNSPAPPEMTAADDQRFQHWYNHNYRFFPTYMNLAQINFDGKEKNGHLYSVLSSLSSSTHGSLTEWVFSKTKEESEATFSTLRKWRAWASDNLDYLRDRIDLFGQPCRKDGIDGTAHIKGDRGFIFVFNPCAEAHYGSIPLSEMIGINRGSKYEITEISTDEHRPMGVYQRNSDFVFEIKGKDALLFELKPTRKALSAYGNYSGKPVQPAFTK